MSMEKILHGMVMEGVCMRSYFCFNLFLFLVCWVFVHEEGFGAVGAALGKGRGEGKWRRGCVREEGE
jgi:hypothetical protein